MFHAKVWASAAKSLELQQRNASTQRGPAPLRVWPPGPKPLWKHFATEAIEAAKIEAKGSELKVLAILAHKYYDFWAHK